MKRNVGSAERVVPVVIGVVLLALVVVGPQRGLSTHRPGVR